MSLFRAMEAVGGNPAAVKHVSFNVNASDSEEVKMELESSASSLAESSESCSEASGLAIQEPTEMSSGTSSESVSSARGCAGKRDVQSVPSLSPSFSEASAVDPDDDAPDDSHLANPTISQSGKSSGDPLASLRLNLFPEAEETESQSSGSSSDASSPCLHYPQSSLSGDDTEEMAPSQPVWLVGAIQSATRSLDQPVEDKTTPHASYCDYVISEDEGNQCVEGSVLNHVVVCHRPPEFMVTGSGESSPSGSDSDVAHDSAELQVWHAGAVDDCYQVRRHEQQLAPKLFQLGHSDVAVARTEPLLHGGSLVEKLEKQEQLPAQCGQGWRRAQGQSKADMEEDASVEADEEVWQSAPLHDIDPLGKHEHMAPLKLRSSAASKLDVEDEVLIQAAPPPPDDGTHLAATVTTPTDSSSMSESREESVVFAHIEEHTECHTRNSPADILYTPEPQENVHVDRSLSVAHTKGACVHESRFARKSGDRAHPASQTLCSPMPTLATHLQQSTVSKWHVPSEEVVPIPSRLSHVMELCGHPKFEEDVASTRTEEPECPLHAQWPQTKTVEIEACQDENSSESESAEVCHESVGMSWLQPAALDSLCGHIALFASAAEEEPATGDVIQQVREDQVDLHVWLLTRDHEELLSSALFRQMLSQQQACKEVKELQRFISNFAQRGGALLADMAKTSRTDNQEAMEVSQRVLRAREMIHMLGSNYVSLCEVLSEVLHQLPELVPTNCSSFQRPAAHATGESSPRAGDLMQEAWCQQHRCLEGALQDCNAQAAQLSMKIDKKTLEVQQAEDQLRALRLQIASQQQIIERQASATPAVSGQPCKSDGTETSEFLRLRAEVQALRSRCSVRRNLSATFEKVV